jgi:hypothetical protein
MMIDIILLNPVRSTAALNESPCLGLNSLKSDCYIGSRVGCSIGSNGEIDRQSRGPVVTSDQGIVENPSIVRIST